MNTLRIFVEPTFFKNMKRHSIRIIFWKRVGGYDPVLFFKPRFFVDGCSDILLIYLYLPLRLPLRVLALVRVR